MSNATYTLPYVEIKILQEDIAEVTVAADATIGVKEISEIHEILESRLVSPYGILIQRSNHYHITFEAQQKISTLTSVNARAIVVEDLVSEANALMIGEISKSPSQNLRLFSDTASALKWLQDIQRMSTLSKK